MRTVFVNGEYVPEDQAQVSIFDRGFLFADAVYEVTAVLNGKLIDFDSHIKRLGRSLGELGITAPLSDDDLLAMHRNLVEKNALKEGVVYMQITRGATDRDFDFSSMQARPTIIAFTQEKKLEANPKFDEGQHIILAEDLRWGRSDIKTTQLLYASLVKTHAKKSGVDDVWMHRDGTITEGSSNNAYIVTHAANFLTRDHLVVDLRHGIDWLRCSVGQVWDGTGCVGDVLTLNHEQIEQAIEQANEQLGGSWRLPSREELEGLVCESCVPPLIDDEVFPNTSAEPYWTGQVNGMAKRHYFSVNFFNGWTYGRFFPSQQLAVRLVRDRY